MSKLQKLQLVLLLSLTASFSWSLFSLPSQAVPSLLCIPKTTAADPSVVTANGKLDQTTPRRIRVYYVNGHREWEAKALVVNDQVKAIIFRGCQRPITKSRIDINGFGTGIDFRDMPWQFHGFLEP
jgi:hypothetical protein